MNEKVVYSKRLLKRWPGQKGKKGGPDFEELIEITYWMEQVIYLILRLVVPGGAGGAGGAITPPDFGRSVNPISTRRGTLCPSNYNWHPRIFRPSYGPA